MLVILHVVKQYYPYLTGIHLKEKVDHDSLEYFLEQGVLLEETQKWVTKIPCYDFEIIYKKAKNMVLDLLSRNDEDIEELLCVISIIQNNWVVEERI